MAPALELAKLKHHILVCLNAQTALHSIMRIRSLLKVIAHCHYCISKMFIAFFGLNTELHTDSNVIVTQPQVCNVSVSCMHITIDACIMVEMLR